MENSGRTNAYEDLIRGCKPCSSLVARVQSIYASGGFIRWPGLTILSITSSQGTNTDGFTVRFEARPTRYQESDGSPVKSLPGGRSVDLLTLEDTSISWVVVGRARTTS
jgi:hypothetical protein